MAGRSEWRSIKPRNSIAVGTRFILRLGGAEKGRHLDLSMA